MHTLDSNRTITAWSSLADTIFVPYIEQDYNHLVALLDQVGEDETHPLASMMDFIGDLIESYEDTYVLEIN
jgi:HTH-type transcriptional regulator/antitoxin HigA